MEIRIFEGEGDAHPLHLQKFGTFPVKNGRAKILVASIEFTGQEIS